MADIIPRELTLDSREVAERYHVDLRELERLSRQKMIEKGYMKEVV